MTDRRAWTVWMRRGLDRNSAMGLIVALAAMAVYANSLGNDFILDDWNIIVNNPALKEEVLSVFGRIDVVGANDLNPYYRPLAQLSYVLDERLHGLKPLPMHLFNLFLHAANAVLVYFLAAALGLSAWAAACAALFFAVHPVNTEAVNFISARNTLLSGLFLVSAFLVHRRAVQEKRLSLAVAGGGLLLAGLLSKETTLVLLPLILALEIPDLRTGGAGDRRAALLRLLPPGLSLLTYLFLRWSVLARQGIQTHLLPGLGATGLENRFHVPPLDERLLNNVYIIPYYLKTLLWPTGLSPTYHVPEDLSQMYLPLAVAWMVIIALAGWLLTRGRSPATIFGMAWAVTFWLPVSGVIFFPSLPMADRYLYIPAIGLCIVAADQVGRIPAQAGGRARPYGIGAAVVVLSALALATVNRNRDWKDDFALFSRAVEQYPENPANYSGLGQAYLNRDSRDPLHLDLAEKAFEKALALEPRVHGVHTRLGYIRLAKGDSEGAVRYYTTALAMYPLDKEALLNRAIALENLGRTAEALEDFRRFLNVPGHELADARPYAEARIRALGAQAAPGDAPEPISAPR